VETVFWSAVFAVAVCAPSALLCWAMSRRIKADYREARAKAKAEHQARMAAILAEFDRELERQGLLSEVKNTEQERQQP